jgi:ATP-dependent Clp protease protease subunit
MGMYGPTNLTPYIMEERRLNVAQMDVFSRLMMDRIIFLGTGIDDQVANIVTAQLLFLESADPSKDIQIYINSPGGSVYAGLGIYDTMQIIKPDVATICTGMAASMGAVLLVARKRKTFCAEALKSDDSPAFRWCSGVASDMEINLREMLKLKQELYDIIAHHSGQTYEWVEKSSDRDYWMTSEEAKSYGMVDEVLQRAEKK